MGTVSLQSYLLSYCQWRIRAQWSPIPKRKWKPIDDRKFGYDVSVRKPTRTDSVSRIKKTLIEYSCVRLSTKFSDFRNLLGHVLGHSSNNLENLNKKKVNVKENKNR